MRGAVLIAAVHTPIGKFQGSLSPLSAVDLGACVVREAVRGAGIEPAQVGESVLGNVLSARVAQNPARQAGLKSRLRPRLAAMTINKACGSGLKAVALAVERLSA
jgi:acetyl-CoA C-acetyltransferase